MNNFKNYWNQFYKSVQWKKNNYDNWLDNYQDVLNQCKTEVLDLGCGIGNNVSYLIEKNFNVIACDYSEIAINIIKQNYNNIKTLLLDISQILPFKDETFDLIIADLSLHYFDEKITCKIMKEIKRILKYNGTLLARVNSVNDINYGAVQGKVIENNFLFVDGYNKRFFTVEDVEKFFSIVGSVKVRETEMLRYAKPKSVFEIEAIKRLEQ